MRTLVTRFVALALICAGCSGPAAPHEGSADSGVDAAVPAPVVSHADAAMKDEPSACVADPTCGLVICSCDNGVDQAPNVCQGTSCNVSGACGTACGGANLGATSYPACTTQSDCSTSQPYINCQCTQGAWTANPLCVGGGYCSDWPADVCPSVCAQQGSGTWAGCAQDSDCAPVVCACLDGTHPVNTAAVGIPSGSCQLGGQCEAAGGYCPSACMAHGGWTAPAATSIDAGTPASGGGMPGDACTDASQCNAQTCACTDGMSFSGFRACDTNTDTCAPLSETCGLACGNDGGWSGK